MQATIYTIKPFDAEFGATIKFNWNGNQAVKNRCIIKELETDEIVYDESVISYKLEHPINIEKYEINGGLANGKKYAAFITVFDIDGNESDIQSMGQIFLCLKTPEYNFVNMIEGKVLTSSSYNFQLSYSQENGELLDSWQIILYDLNNNILSDSGVKYDTELLSHTFTGFATKNQYKIRAVGQTVNGMSLDTGYIQFSVTYDFSNIFSMIDVTNIPKTGSILLHSNIISADGKTEKEPVEYIDGKYVDLVNNKLIYDEGFLFRDNFSLVLYAYHITPNTPFFCFYSKDDPNFEGQIAYRVGRIGSSDWVGYLELQVTNGITTYLIESNRLPVITENTMIGLCLVRENGYYNLEFTNLGEVDIT